MLLLTVCIYLQLPGVASLGRSTRQSGIYTSRVAFTDRNELDIPRSCITDDSPGKMPKISGVQRGSSFSSSLNPKHASSRKVDSNLKNYETTLRGIDSLHFGEEERRQY